MASLCYDETRRSGNPIDPILIILGTTIMILKEGHFLIATVSKMRKVEIIIRICYAEFAIILCKQRAVRK